MATGPDAPQFFVGDIVNLTITGAKVLHSDTDQDGYRDLTVETADSRRIALVTVPLDHKGVVVDQIAPADWPPQVGDLWRDRHGDLWFAYIQPMTDPDDLLYMRTAKGGRWSVGFDDQLENNGPWALVHREPAGGGVARALNQLAEPAGAGLDLAAIRGRWDHVECAPDDPAADVSALIAEVEQLRARLAACRCTQPAPKDSVWLSPVGIDLHRVLPHTGDSLRIGCTTPVLGYGTVGTYELMRRRPNTRPCALPGCWPGAT